MLVYSFQALPDEDASRWPGALLCSHPVYPSYTWSSDEVELDARGLVPKEYRGRVYGTEVGWLGVGDVVDDRVIGTCSDCWAVPAVHVLSYT